MSLNSVYKSGLSLVREIGESFRFAWLYTVYGMGHRWSFPAAMSGKRPDNFLGKVSWDAMRAIDEAETSWYKEAGYIISGCGMPGAAFGEAVYFFSRDGRRDAAQKKPQEADIQDNIIWHGQLDI